MQTFLTLVNRLALFFTGGAWLCLGAAVLLCLFFLFSSPEISFQHGSELAGPPAQLSHSRPILRAAVPAHTRSTGRVAPFGPGFEEELLQRFSERAGYTLRLLPVADSAAAQRLLRLGLADVVAGFAPPASADVVTGPPYFHARSMLMPASQPNSPEDITTQALPAAEADATASPAQTLAEEELWRLDARSWALWAPFLAQLNEETWLAAQESTHESYHWVWRSGEALSAKLEAFWHTLMQPEEGTLNTLEDRYFSYFKGRDQDNVLYLFNVLEKRLPRYSKLIAKAAAQADIDPLLLTAVIIQESQLDENCVSHTGVRGIMQLTQETAAFLGVDRMDAAQAIQGGARYLRMLWDTLEGTELDEWDRWFCVLAAFNQGPLRLKGAISLSVQLGGGQRWSELKKTYPLLARPRYAAMVGQSTCRGQEAVTFVDNVRWHYHILRGLIALGRPEAQYIAPLLGGFRR